jgi:hypothetical protein
MTELCTQACTVTYNYEYTSVESCDLSFFPCTPVRKIILSLLACVPRHEPVLHVQNTRLLPAPVSTGACSEAIVLVFSPGKREERGRTRHRTRQEPTTETKP